MPKQVFQSSDGKVFTTFEAANEYEVQQEMEEFERLGLDDYLQEVADEEGEGGEVYHQTRLQLSDLLGWCARNDKVLSITGKNDTVYRRERPEAVDPDATSGAERGFPDTSIPPGMRADPTKPVPYEPAPAEGGCARR
jgi:hypothetical protein